MMTATTTAKRVRANSLSDKGVKVSELRDEKGGGGGGRGICLSKKRRIAFTRYDITRAARSEASETDSMPGPTWQ